MSTQPAHFLEHRSSAEAGSDLGSILRALDGLVASAEPAVVFTSLARLCVPLICDAATVALKTADQQAYLTKWPWSAADPEDSALVREAMAGRQVVSHDAVLTPILGMSTEGVLDYQGVLTLAFHTERPGPSHRVLAQLVVERAVTLIERERLAELATALQTKVDNLGVALTTNRQIGIAIGIIMANHKLTGDHAFDLLRRVSQHSHRKIHDIAVDVVDAGVLELPAGLTAMAPPVAPGTETGTASGRRTFLPGPHTSLHCAPRH
ncbi:MAG TPA: ANTAR domain-containing protein [Jatrophihabitans sp.]|jgi:hypothetical protein|uniref:ANTAR domain-containing protein n=1 Tax=Jatrophihabitans sp. TaxID=1932789 RepID=UPI002F0120EC